MVSLELWLLFCIGFSSTAPNGDSSFELSVWNSGLLPYPWQVVFLLKIILGFYSFLGLMQWSKSLVFLRKLWTGRLVTVLTGATIQ